MPLVVLVPNFPFRTKVNYYSQLHAWSATGSVLFVKYGRSKPESFAHWPLLIKQEEELGVFIDVSCTSVSCVFVHGCMFSESLRAQWDDALARWVLNEAVALIWKPAVIKPEKAILKYNFHSHNTLILQLSYCPTGLFFFFFKWCVHVCEWNKVKLQRISISTHPYGDKRAREPDRDR